MSPSQSANHKRRTTPPPWLDSVEQAVQTYSYLTQEARHEAARDRWLEAEFTHFEPPAGTLELMRPTSSDVVNIEAPKLVVRDLTTIASSPLDFELKATDGDSCELIFEIIAQPSFGSLSIPIDQPCESGSVSSDWVALRYTAAKDFKGKDDFVVVVSDGEHTSEPQTVTVVVEANTKAVFEPKLPEDADGYLPMLDGGAQETLQEMTSFEAVVEGVDAVVLEDCADPTTQELVSVLDDPKKVGLMATLDPQGIQLLDELSVPLGCLAGYQLMISQMMVTVEGKTHLVELPETLYTLNVNVVGGPVMVFKGEKVDLALEVNPFELLERDATGFKLKQGASMSSVVKKPPPYDCAPWIETKEVTNPIGALSYYLKAGQTYQWETTDLSPGGDTVMHLYELRPNTLNVHPFNAVGESIFDDDGGLEPLASRLTFSPPQSGWYAIVVRAFSDETFGSAQFLFNGAPDPRLSKIRFGGVFTRFDHAS